MRRPLLTSLLTLAVLLLVAACGSSQSTPATASAGTRTPATATSAAAVIATPASTTPRPTGTPAASPTGTATPLATPASTPKPATPAATVAATTPATAAGPTEVKVDIVNFAFQPATITIPAGTTVVWTNTSPTEHTVADKNLTWSSHILEQGQTYQRTFDQPGTFTYICTIHPEMVGTIIVK